MALCLAILCSAASAGHGQSAPDTTPVCRRDAPHEAPSTVIDTLFAWIPRRGSHEGEAGYAFRVAQVRAVLASLPPLKELAAPGGSQLNYPLAPAGAGELREARPLVWFQVRNDGRLSGLALQQRSSWPALDLEVQRAILRADSARRLRPLPTSLRDEPIDLWLAVGTRRHTTAESVPVGTYLSTRASDAVVQVPPRLLGFGYRPHFPAAAMAQHAGDSLVVSFVVDTTGRVDSTSIELVQATWREFAQEAIRVVLSARFTPGRIDGCTVRVRLRQPIFFDFRDR